MLGRRKGAALAALEAAVLPALLRPPCVVTFSGGTDSALVLAVATSVARRLGLADPVPFSWRFPTVPATEESGPQRRVVGALGLEEWVIETPDQDHLDVVGPAGRHVLLRQGTRHPANVHFHERAVELATGGSVLTGAGGDQILSGWLRPENRSPARRAKNRVPPFVRVRLKRLPQRRLPWIRRDVAAALLRAHLQELADEPVAFAARVRWHAGRRDLALGLGNLVRLGESHDVRLLNPLADHGLVHALAQELGDQPAPRRSDLVAALVGDAVPAVVWEPRRKARFGAVFLAGPTRALVRSWDGDGVDPAVVDVAALRRAWSVWPVPLATAGLVQQVFLSREAPTPEQETSVDDRSRAWTRHAC